MRKNINGEPAISREIWAVKAFASRRFSDALTKLLSVHKSESETQLYAALREMIETQDRYAIACDELKQATKIGRPRILVPKVPQKNAPKKRPGRPVIHGPADDKHTYEWVELIRNTPTAKNSPKPTIRTAVDQINSEFAKHLKLDDPNSKFAKDLKLDVKTYVRENYNRIRSSYSRGKKLSKP